MAGVDVVSSGPLSKLARAQYVALTAMRWKMFVNGLRSFRGAAELGARIIVGIIFGGMGFGVAFGLGAGAYQIVSSGRWQLLPILFWVVFFLWQVLPITLASFQEQFDFGGMLRFPVSFGTFFVLHVIFGLVDAGTLAGGLCCTGIGVGMVIAAPNLFGWIVLMLVVFALFNLFLSRAVFAWIERWLAQRRTREIVSVVFLLLVLGGNFFNPAFRKASGTPQFSAETQAAVIHDLHTANSVQRWLPPGLAARGFEAAVLARPVAATESFALLGLFVVIAGGALALRLGAEYRGENLGDAPARKQEMDRNAGRWLLDGSGPIAAVVEKEIRTIMRALNLLYALGAPLIIVFLIAKLFQSAASGGTSYGLLICLAYAFAGFTMLIYNNLGAEGAGIQVLFLSPTPIRTVIFAKNVFHAVLFAVDAALVCVLASLRYGAPSPNTLATVIAWLAFALPVHLAFGNMLSLALPYRLNLGRIGRQKGSQANALLGMAVQVAVLGIGAGILFLCIRSGRPWFAPLILLGLAVVAWTGWLRSLPAIERMAHRRRERLLEVLVRTE